MEMHDSSLGLMGWCFHLPPWAVRFLNAAASDCSEAVPNDPNDPNLP